MEIGNTGTQSRISRQATTASASKDSNTRKPLLVESDDSRVGSSPEAAVPQELIEQIIDELHSDRETLRACALTHHAWLHRSRTHLHRTVTLYHQHCRIHASQVENAFRLLALPYIAKYARHLVLEGKTDYGRRDVNPDGADNEALFWRILSSFAHVTSLRLTRLFWVSHSLENKERLCRVFHSVTNLDVYMSDFADLHEFLSFLSGFPQLTRLKAERVLWFKTAEEWQHQTGSDTSSYRTLPAEALPGASLRSLNVQHCNLLIMADVANWLSSSPSIPVETLHLSPPDGDDYGALSLYCHAIGPTLKHLTLDLEIATKEETMRQAVEGLELLTQLESVTFVANFGFGRKFVHTASIFWPCVIVSLERIATTTLHTIRFECQLEDLSGFGLLQADELLSRPAFSRLKDVTFAFADIGLPKDLDKIIQMALPRTASRGIVRRISFLPAE